MIYLIDDIIIFHSYQAMFSCILGGVEAAGLSIMAHQGHGDRDVTPAVVASK